MSTGGMTLPAGSAANAATSSAFTDIRGMQAMTTDSPEAIEKVAAQFESLFLDMWLKSMREAGSVFAEGNPFSSQAVKVHEQMLDHQYAVHLSEAGGVGIGQALVAQLTRPSASPVESISDDPNATAGLPERRLFSQPGSKRADIEVESFGSRASLFDSAREFIDELLPVVEQAVESSPLNPVLVLAQAALETGWGKKIIHDDQGVPSFNLFGVKASNWDGPSAPVQSLESEFGQMVPRRAEFRVYEGWQQSVDDYVTFLGSQERYQPVLEAAADAQSFAQQLQRSGYATDPDYAEKLMGVVKSISRSLDDLAAN